MAWKKQCRDSLRAASLSAADSSNHFVCYAFFPAAQKLLSSKFLQGRAKMGKLLFWIAATSVVILAGKAQAALVDRGGGLIYDSTRNITWLADMNYANTSGYADFNGRMSWTDANVWAKTLAYGGYDDWRLPTLYESDKTCSAAGGGYGCTGGELSGLFTTDLGTQAYESVREQKGDTAEQIANLALFRNIQLNAYWSNSVFTSQPRWGINYRAQDGCQCVADIDAQLYAVAVRPGDVIASVPEPQTLTLALLGLAAVSATRKRKQNL
jgi:hypothetical protein